MALAHPALPPAPAARHCSELNAKLEWYASATAALHLGASWDPPPLTAEASGSSMPYSAPTSGAGAPPAAAAGQTAPGEACQPSQGGSTAGPPAAVAESLEGLSAEALQPAGSAAGSSGGAAAGAAAAHGPIARKSGGRSTEPSAAGSAEAAVEALAAALPLRMNTQAVLRNSTAERRGECWLAAGLAWGFSHRISAHQWLKLYCIPFLA